MTERASSGCAGTAAEDPWRWSGYPNPAEMFAYVGQWYLAGFGEVVRELSPELFELCAELIGDARIEPEGLNAEGARASLTGLLAWFSSGQHR